MEWEPQQEATFTCGRTMTAGSHNKAGALPWESTRLAGRTLSLGVTSETPAPALQVKEASLDPDLGWPAELFDPQDWPLRKGGIFFTF